MGADMIFAILWTENGETNPKEAKIKIKELLENETNLETINFLNAKIGKEDFSEELYANVMLADQELKKTWIKEVSNYYNELIDSVEITLNSREVSTIRLSENVIGYATGGMSWGDSPTEALDVWAEFLSPYDEYTQQGNPYLEEAAYAYGILKTQNSMQENHNNKKILEVSITNN